MATCHPVVLGKRKRREGGREGGRVRENVGATPLQ